MLLKMENKIENKFEGIDEQRILTNANILDPKFKKRGFNKIVSYQRAYQKIIQSVTTIIQSKNINVTKEEKLNDMQFEIWKEFDLQVLLMYFKT